MNRKCKKWTNEEELVIISMRKEGKTLKEIAFKLGRTPSAVGVKCHQLINACKLEKKVGGVTSKINYEKIGKYVSESPNNIRLAFKKYGNESGYSWQTIASAYYHKKQHRGRTRVKDAGNWFTIIGQKGHTISNNKIGKSIKRSNLWTKLKDLLVSSLLS